MKLFTLTTIALLSCGTVAAQEVILAGHVQRVVLQPSGTENCPPPCPPVKAATNPSEPQRICVSNAGGCQTMELKVSRVFRGADPSRTRQFKSRIGEWGPSFPVTDKQIVVREESGNVFWSVATEREGKIFVDAKRLGNIGGVATSAKGEDGMVALDEMLDRGSIR